MHWHEEFQFIYVSSGSLTVHTLSDTLKLSEGEALYLGPEVIHCIEAPVDAHYYNFPSSAKVLRFYPGCPANEDLSALFAENFISFAPLSPVLPWARESLDLLKDLARFEKDKPPFYAWEVILRLFRLLLSVRKHHNPQERPARDANAEKAKIILQFHRRPL
ncbi:cupin domain-containing protein [Dialister sp.]|uniref:cupin domain-containing protein n=1 Tax=Dialister sp. TaxID=1955814 RepID=UPI002E81467B|nr:AraC family ligand binding domain-containing protein [Dialister sp.]MEE3452439.1 AraC family ligand binding domain-containing protein [Dialister sp.]